MASDFMTSEALGSLEMCSVSRMATSIVDSVVSVSSLIGSGSVIEALQLVFLVAGDWVLQSVPSLLTVNTEHDIKCFSS